MSLSNLVVARETGTFGTFEVKDGNVTKASKAVLVFFNTTTALVPMDARSSFTTADEHTAFDATLMALSTAGTPIQYVDSISKFMDPTARFNEFLSGKLIPKSVGLTLTPEELAVPTAFASAKAKFEALFKAPTPPRELASDDGTRALTLVVNSAGTVTHINNGSYKMGVAQAKAIWRKLDPIWAKTPATGTRHLGYISARHPGRTYSEDCSYSATNLSIGCQTISRYQIEQLALAEGWIA